MQHLLLTLSILLLTGIAGKNYQIATDANHTILMQMEKIQESKINVTSDTEENDDCFFYGVIVDMNSF
jgi:hypothetical protein